LFAWTPITPGLASPTSGGCGSCIGRDGAVLTILVAAALYFASGPTIDPILSAPMMPGFFLAMLLGVRGGPDGMPSIVYVFGLSFLFWWIAMDLVWRIWRWVAKNV
jgi:hypothetical protein